MNIAAHAFFKNKNDQCGNNMSLNKISFSPEK